MQRLSTTVLAVVGADARQAAEALGRAANVRAVLTAPGDQPLERARAALAAAAGASAPYVVHDADPLAEVADAWVRWYDGDGPRGELETAVTAVVARWRAGSVELPDYYLLLDAHGWPATRRHWYLGWLHRHAPARVVPAGADRSALPTTVSRLRAGRWWPPLDRLLDGADRVAPDEFVAAGEPGADRRQQPLLPDGRPTRP